MSAVMDPGERLALGVSLALLAAFFVALVYAARGLDIDVPTCVDDVAPFTTGQVIDHGEGRYEVHLVARMWAFDPPEVRLPVGAEVDLYVAARDVVHGVYIQDTDVNLMAVPGAVSAARVRFDRPGTYWVLCHEYCGAGHQNMAGVFVVGDAPAAAAAVPAAAAAAPERGDAVATGQRLFAEKGCVACHTIDGSPGVGPTLKALLGREESLADGTTVVVDETFIEEQIRFPNKRPIKGFPPIMPALPLTDAEVEALVAYVKTL